MQVAPFLMDNHASLKLHEKKEEEKKGGGGGGRGRKEHTDMEISTPPSPRSYTEGKHYYPLPRERDKGTREDILAWDRQYQSATEFEPQIPFILII